MTHRFSRAAKAFAVMVTALACADVAASDTVTGSLAASKNDGAGTYTCLGSPTCSGVANLTITKNNGCSNSTFSFSSAISFTNIDLSHVGPFSGSFTIAQVQQGHTQNADGTCTYILVPGMTWPYDGSWDGQNGTLTVHATDGSGLPDDFSGTFTAQVSDVAPVFPMNVTGSVTPTTTNGSATIQPRPQEAGTQQSIFVFTHAPSSLVTAPGAKAESGSPHLPAASDDAVVCVLAQVTADGTLIAASAGALEATFSGVLTSAGQAVQLLNNVPTPNVAGATVFVGYGTTSGAMLASGVFQAAMSVPGPVQCTASLAAAPAPASPGVLSGLWWNTSESGWGIHFTQRGKNLFAAWYTYDTSGNPKWYVAPNCGFANANAISGTCTSSLFEVDGPTFFGVTFHSPTASQVKNVGTLQLDFQGPNTASIAYTLGSFTRTVPIVRQVFPVAQSPTPAVDYTDLWWNPSESGWGMAITHQFGNIFLAWYVYDANGKPFWYVAPACTVQGSGCSGTLYRTTGPAFGPPLDPTKVQAIAVGSAIVSFIDSNNGVLSFIVDGVSATKPITRQLF